LLTAFAAEIVVISPGTYQRRGTIAEDLKINKMPLQNARAAGLLGDDTAPDACFKNCKGGRGYIVSHVNSSAETLVKLLLTAANVSVLKYVPPPQRKRTRAGVAAAASAEAPVSGWLPLALDEIANPKQLLETMSWMCLCLQLKPSSLAAEPLQPLVLALEKTTRQHEMAVVKLRAAAAAKRSETAEKKAILEKKKAMVAAVKASKAIARIAAGDDGGAEEEKDGSDSDNAAADGDDDDDDDGVAAAATAAAALKKKPNPAAPSSKKRRVHIHDNKVEEEEDDDVYKGPKTVAGLLKELSKRSKTVKTLKADLKHVIKRRNTQATIAFLGQARQNLDDQLLRLIQNERQRMSSKDLREDLKTEVFMDALGTDPEVAEEEAEEEDEDNDTQVEDEEEEEGEEEEDGKVGTNADSENSD
jgi:hypothetical protein